MQQHASRRDFLRASAATAALALPIWAGGPSAQAATTAGKPGVPGSYTGPDGVRRSLAYLGVHDPGDVAGCSDPAVLEQVIGRRFAINHHFRSPPESDWAPLRDAMRKDRAAGRIPMLSYAAGKAAGYPDTETGARQAAYARLLEITNGRRDAQIDGQAAALAALGGPAFLRFTWEFDIRYFGTAGATAFLAAWRYVHHRFQRAGATNVAFVWSPTWRAFADSTARHFYPGDRFVDWIAADGYSRCTSYPSFSALFTAANVFAVQHGKPFMVAETGVHRLGRQDDALIGPTAQSSWLDELRTTLAINRFANLKALLYFHVDGDNSPQPNHWRVTTPQDGPAARSFKALAWNPRLKARPPANTSAARSTSVIWRAV